MYASDLFRDRLREGNVWELQLLRSRPRCLFSSESHTKIFDKGLEVGLNEACYRY
jgi:hypothetical protein